jgi:hypothetical protein
LLAKQSLCVKTAKHCWELLEEAFVYRNQVAVSPKGKSKMRHDFSIEEVILSESPSREPGVVADEAWPFLGWLVSLFEKDEVFEFQTEHGTFLLFLLLLLRETDNGVKFATPPSFLTSCRLLAVVPSRDGILRSY